MKRRSLLKAALVAPLTFLFKRFPLRSEEDSLLNYVTSPTQVPERPLTLLEHVEKTNDDLLKGVIENTINANSFFLALPFDTVDGNAIAYKREDTKGTLYSAYSSLSDFVGDIDVTDLLNEDSCIAQISCKAKHVGRMFMVTLASHLQSLCKQKIAKEKASLKVLDKLLKKTSGADFFLMHTAAIQSIKNIYPLKPAKISSWMHVLSYKGIPIFRNNYIKVENNETTIFAGKFDDGTRTHGIAGLCRLNNAAGFSVPEDYSQVKWCAGMALYNERDLACATVSI